MDVSHNDDMDLRKLRFDYAKQVAAFNTAYILVLNYLAQQATSPVPIAAVFGFWGAIALFVLLLFGSMNTMKKLADGLPLSRIEHAGDGGYYRQLFGGALFVVAVLFAIPSNNPFFPKNDQSNQAPANQNQVLNK